MIHDTLIDSKTLLKHVESEDWHVFDCRCSPADPGVGRRQFLEGHIPGARHADLDRVLAARPSATTGRHPLPDRNELGAWLGTQGVGQRTQVVVYDDSGGAFAARLWWLARWLGHAATAVLDGGLSAWREIGGALEGGDSKTPARAVFTVGESLMSLVDADEVLAIAQGRAAGRLVDARAAARYRGDEEPIDPLAGHIPGAENRPFAGNLDERGHFRSCEQLRRRFADLADSPKDVVNYCGSGVTACHNVLAMEHAGLHGSRLYPGSWSEWIRDPARPLCRSVSPVATRC